MKKRNITSFEAEPDVQKLLVMVAETGITIREVANRTLRDYGYETAKKIAKEKRRRLSFRLPIAVPIGEYFSALVAA